MEAVKLFEKKDVRLDWEYDGEADTLDISFGPPKPATGVDVGEGVTVWNDESAREVVGLTIIGVGRRLEAATSLWSARYVMRVMTLSPSRT